MHDAQDGFDPVGSLTAADPANAADPATPAAQAVDVDIDRHAVDQQPEVARLQIVGLIAVAIGGAAGAVLRELVVAQWALPSARFPWPVFAINCVGAFVVGALMTWLHAHHEPGPRAVMVRQAVGAGFCGGFTTFSAYVAGTKALAAGDLLTAAVYATATLAAALLAIGAGVAVTRLLMRVRDQSGSRR